MKRRWGAALKLVRRFHMYLGLLMYPWVLLYGLSGLLFNHPQVGRDLSPHRLAPKELTRMTGFEPWDPDVVAQAVVAALNSEGGGDRYRIDGDAELVGFPILVSPSPEGGRHVLIMSLTAGRAGIAHHPAAREPPQAPFAGSVQTTPEYTMAAVARQLSPLTEELGIHGPPLRAHPKVAPELRFVLRDGRQRWNAVYDLRTGELSGRPSDGETGVSFVELLGKLHTQHHFPVHWGTSGYWAIFADLTGLSLMLWALSGLVMWWQIRPSRRWGAAVIILSLGLAAAVMTGMAQELTFLGVEPSEGP